jgi:LacI family transcriptional regulator
MATITDVAKRAKVGVGTVSRVLNDSPLVRPETRQRVLRAMEELEYRPSRTARGLSSGRTHLIGVLVPFFTEPSAVARLRGVVSALAGSEYDVVLYPVETPAQVVHRFDELERSPQVDGLIILSLPLTQAQEDLLVSSRLPTALVDRRSSQLPAVVVDDVRGGHLATEHLLGLGHERIAFVGEPPSNPFGFTSSADRERGYREALAEAGLRPAVGYVKHGAHRRSIATRLASELFRLPEPPTAVVAASDTQALGTIEAARSLGIQVPGQLSIVGYDDVEVAGYVGLTTVRQPLHLSGERGAQLLLEHLAGRPSGVIEEQLALELVVRGTTAPPEHLRRVPSQRPQQLQGQLARSCTCWSRRDGGGRRLGAGPLRRRSAC